MLRLIFPLLLLLGGCASLDDVVGGIANTPEWFQERRVEIRGEGYPDLTEVPDGRSIGAIGARLQATEALARQDLEAFLTDPRTLPANTTREDIEQEAARLRALLPDLPLASDELLSEAEISAMRAKLRVPPVNKPK